MKGYIVGKLLGGILLEVYSSVMMIAILIAWYDTFFKRKAGRRKFIISIGLYVITYLAMRHYVDFILRKYLVDSEVVWMIATLVLLVLEAILEWILFVRKYAGSIKKKIRLYIPYIIVIPTVEILAMLMMNEDLIVARKSSYYIEIINNVTLLIMMYLIVLCIGELYRFKKNKNSNLHFAVFAIALAAQGLLHYVFEQAFLTITNDNNLILCLLGYCLSATILLCISVLYQKHQTDLEYKRLEGARQRLFEQRLDYYQTLDETTDEIKRIKHDFKKFLLIINQLVQANQLEALDEYLKSVVEYTSFGTTIVAANNLTVSAILTLMLERCQENGIEFQYVLQYKQLSIADIDLSIILGNILENAFEASVQVEDVTKRNIRLSIQASKGVVLIGCKNDYIGTVKKKGRDIKSSKAEENHGLGLTNIRNAAEDYGGKVDIKTSEQTFEIHVTLYTNR